MVELFSTDNKSFNHINFRPHKYFAMSKIKRKFGKPREGARRRGRRLEQLATILRRRTCSAVFLKGRVL